MASTLRRVGVGGKAKLRCYWTWGGGGEGECGEEGGGSRVF